MTKIKLKVAGIEVEYEGDEESPETRVLYLLEEAKRSHNEESKRSLLECYGGLQQNLITLEDLSTSMAGLNEDLASRMGEFSERTMQFLEEMRMSSGSQKEVIELATEMQKMNMSFSLQYLGIQQKIQSETRQFTILSNIMKVKHDVAKNAINNIR